MYTWPHDVPNDGECPHKHSIGSSTCQVQTNHGNAASMDFTSQQTKRDNFDLCHALAYRQSVGNEQMASPCTNRQFPRRGEHPQATNVCQKYEGLRLQKPILVPPHNFYGCQGFFPRRQSDRAVNLAALIQCRS